MSHDPSEIRNRAIGLLARREHSAKELFHKLTLRGYDEAPVTLVIETLVKEGLQSDNRFTEMYVHARIQKGYGPLRIRQELRERGIGDDQIARYLARPDEEWLQLVRQVREKKFGKALPGDIKSKMKQSRFLRQRGFSGELISKAMRTVED